MPRNLHNKSMSSSIEKTNHKLELDEDLKLHNLGWKVQMIGWVLMGLIFILAALGLFGSGPLSNRSINEKNISLDYEYFGRFESNTKTVIRFPANAISTLAIPLSYLKEMKLQQVIPEPQEKKIENGNYIMSFSGLDEGKIILYLLPQTSGAVQTVFRINEQPYTINHFIYP